MRYIVIFSDRTSKRVSAESAAIFRAAMKTREPVDYKGCVYAGYSIVAIKPIHMHEQEIRDEAKESGLFRCKYGRTHLNKSECLCKDAGYKKILEAEEERFLLEEGSARKTLPQSIEEQDAKTLGITDSKLLREVPKWTKAGSLL